MARTLTDAHFNNTSAVVTRPIFVVQLQHSGAVEYLSSSGDITFDNVSYAAGGVEVDSISDNYSATLTLHATNARIQECVNGSWRGNKLCRLYGIPASPADDNYFNLDDGLLLLDGIINDSRVSGRSIKIQGIHKYSSASYTPRLNCSETSNLIPAAGSVFSWQNGSYVLVSKNA